MEKQSFKVKFDDVDAFSQEFESNLCHGGTFVRGATGLTEGDDIDIALVHPQSSAELEYKAVVVWVTEEGDDAGAGVAIRDFGPTKRDEIGAFIRSGPRAPRSYHENVENLHERLRKLSVPEQQKVAKGGDVNERIQLERIYGKLVWEPILRNPRVTVPEVARISRMGSLPKPLFDIIAANTAFLRVPQIRRALLANPKTPPNLVDKVLKLAPRAELRMMPSQPTYSRAVRDKARKLLLNS
jgi:uncharacterized protein (TIGR02266 family)